MSQPQRPLPGQRRKGVGQMKEDFHNDMNDDSMMNDGRSTPPIIVLHDNSTGQTRGWGEPLLFVPGSPQAIRPSGSLRLDYDWESIRRDKPRFSVILKADDDENAHDSIQLRSAHQLCILCKDTLNYFCRYQESGQDHKKMKNNVVHSDSLSSLFISASMGQCFICRQTWAKIKKIYPKLDPAAYSDYIIECIWYPRTREDEEIKIWMVMYNPSVQKRPMHNYQHILRLGLWPKKHFGTHFDKETNQKEEVVSRGTWDDCVDDNTNNHANTRSLALTWLSRCMQDTDGKHDICNRKDGDFLPTRLLDVRHALEGGFVRLVCPSEVPEAFVSDPKYASLSHCWGKRGAKENPLLLTTNMATRKSEGLAWDKLPQSFQDAFKIASWLKLDWIWIDSLCVIQDSKSDWQREAAMMDKVYMNAEVNVSADLGKDSQAGCFVSREEVDISLLEFAACQLDQSWIVTTEDTFGWMDSARSLSRAWIHRERQLSRRILHFTAKEVVWECCGLGKACFASERIPGGAPFEKIFNGETKFQIQRDIATATASISKQDQLDKLHRLWNSTCQDLSNKSITYPTDLPIILSSLAREFHAFMPDDEYVAGLWRSTLAEGLTWWVPGDKLENTGYIAPSWSWLSIASPVMMYEPSHHLHKRAVMEILDISVSPGPLSDNTYGQLAEGSFLRARGFLRRLHFHFTAHENGGIILSVIEADENGQDRLRRIGVDWDDDIGLTFRYTTDGLLKLPYQELECYALFTTLDEWAQFHWDCRRKLTCLLLEKVSQDDNRYRRIGTLEHISDLNSLKLRYQVAPEATVPEAGVSREDYEENPDNYTGQPWFYDDANTKNQETKAEATEGSEDIWDSLTRYITWHRWHIIRNFEKERKAVNARAKNSDDQENEEEVQDDDEETEQERREERKHLTDVIGQILDHPSSGVTEDFDDEDFWDRMREFIMFRSKTVAYGSDQQDVEAALYQFDDVLDMCRGIWGAVPWLKRLEPCEVILI